MKTKNMKITALVGLYDANVYILEKGQECLIIDGGVEVEKVKKVVGGKKVVGVFLTHGHFDHCFYANDYAKEFDCPVYAHKNARITMADSEGICSPSGQRLDNFSSFIFFDEEKRVKLGEFEIDIFHLAGHSHCQCGYLIDENLFCGDFLFAKSFGRIDLKYSNKGDMIASLLKSQDIGYHTLFSGHGEPSTKDEQIAHLPLFIKFLTRN